jgi:hypothetical protein
LLLLAPGIGYGWFKLFDQGLPPASPLAREVWLERHLPGYSAVAPLRSACSPRDSSAETGCGIYLNGFFTLRYYLPGRVLGDLYGPYRTGELRALWRDPPALAGQLDAWEVTHLVLLPRRAAALLQQPGAGQRFRELWKGVDVAVLERLSPDG